MAYHIMSVSSLSLSLCHSLSPPTLTERHGRVGRRQMRVSQVLCNVASLHHMTPLELQCIASLRSPPCPLMTVTMTMTDRALCVCFSLALCVSTGGHRQRMRRGNGLLSRPHAFEGRSHVHPEQSCSVDGDTHFTECTQGYPTVLVELVV